LTTEDSGGDRPDIIAGIIGDDIERLADYLDWSDEDLLHAYHRLTCVHAEVQNKRELVLDMVRKRWPDLFDSGLVSDDRCLPLIMMTQELKAILSEHPDGDYPIDELKRIRAIGEQIYQLGDTVNLQIARSLVEESLGEAVRRRLDRIWYSDLERIPFDDYYGCFKGLD